MLVASLALTQKRRPPELPLMRWIVIAIVGIASAGLLAVSVSINFAFGSSFGSHSS